MQRRPLLTIMLAVGSYLIAQAQAVDFATVRTINGQYNNLFNPGWGSAGENLFRLTTVGYEDGISLPAGSDRPTPRLVSNALFAQEGLVNDPLTLSDFCWVFGQFIDHDITLDVSSALGHASNPDDIRNVRTPRLDLDCVFGGGCGPRKVCVK